MPNAVHQADFLFLPHDTVGCSRGWKIQRSSKWVAQLPVVVSTLNGKVTRLTGRTFAEAITEKAFYSKPVTSYHRPLGVSEKWLPSSAVVRYLYQPGEIGGRRNTATDPIWSLKVYHIEKPIAKPNELILYNLFAWRVQVWLHWRGTSCCACQHQAAALLITRGTQLAPCGCHLEAPSICSGRHFVSASFGHSCTSLLRSFSFLLFVVVSMPPCRARLNRSQSSLFEHFEITFEDTFTFLFSSSYKDLPTDTLVNKGHDLFSSLNVCLLLL